MVERVAGAEGRRLPIQNRLDALPANGLRRRENPLVTDLIAAHL